MFKYKMIVFQKEWMGALSVSLITLVSMFIVQKKDEKPAIKHADSYLKAFIISFTATYLILYFMNNSISNEVMDNVLTSDPDF
jgi:hypothetical protein